MEREQVYKLIDGERGHQDYKWDEARRNAGRPIREDYATVESWILWMEEWLSYARREASNHIDKTEALAMIRKTTALGVACMEHLGAPERHGI